MRRHRREGRREFPRGRKLATQSPRDCVRDCTRTWPSWQWRRNQDQGWLGGCHALLVVPRTVRGGFRYNGVGVGAICGMRSLRLELPLLSGVTSRLRAGGTRFGLPTPLDFVRVTTCLTSDFVNVLTTQQYVAACVRGGLPSHLKPEYVRSSPLWARVFVLARSRQRCCSTLVEARL